MKAAAGADALFMLGRIIEAVSGRRGRGGLGATETEVQTLCYIAAQAHAISESTDSSWPYEFFSTETAEPFAPDIASALRAWRVSGDVIDAGEFLTLSERGRERVLLVTRLSDFRMRSDYLLAASDLALLLPLPSIINAWAVEPTLATGGREQRLLDESSVNVLAPYFEVLRTLVGPEGGLTSLLESWAQYLILTRYEAEVA